MKKFLLLICAVALVITGCGGGEKKTPDEFKIGTITRLNVSEILLDNYFEKAASRMAQTSDLAAPKHIFFDNMNAMIAGLQSGQIDVMSTYRAVADYVIARNDNFELSTKRVPKISDSFCCALRQEDSALKDSFDLAIKELEVSGKLKELTKTYINDLKGNDPPAVEMPHFDGAETIKIAVTGDLPPLDLVTSDGKPAGFNTALLAEISSLIEKNFELVQVDSGARASALTSKQVDVVFWVTVPLDDTIVPPDYDKPEGVIVTEPYFTDEIAHVKLKN